MRKSSTFGAGGALIIVTLFAAPAWAQFDADWVVTPESEAEEESESSQESEPESLDDDSSVVDPFQVETTREAPEDKASDSFWTRYAPRGNSVELGIFTGVLWPSGAHNLVNDDVKDAMMADEPLGHYQAAFALGGRLAYFPSSVLGIEAEFLHGDGRIKDGSGASFASYRIHALAQLLPYSLSPFVLFGANLLQATSEDLGKDTDPGLHFGAGAKLSLSDVVQLRLDFRENLSDRANDKHLGVAWHEELTFGLSFIPRTAADRADPAAD